MRSPHHAWVVFALLAIIACGRPKSAIKTTFTQGIVCHLGSLSIDLPEGWGCSPANPSGIQLDKDESFGWVAISETFEKPTDVVTDAEWLSQMQSEISVLKKNYVEVSAPFMKHGSGATIYYIEGPALKKGRKRRDGYLVHKNGVEKFVENWELPKAESKEKEDPLDILLSAKLSQASAAFSKSSDVGCTYGSLSALIPADWRCTEDRSTQRMNIWRKGTPELIGISIQIPKPLPSPSMTEQEWIKKIEKEARGGKVHSQVKVEKGVGLTKYFLESPWKAKSSPEMVRRRGVAAGATSYSDFLQTWPAAKPEHLTELSRLWSGISIP